MCVYIYINIVSYDEPLAKCHAPPKHPLTSMLEVFDELANILLQHLPRREEMRRS